MLKTIILISACVISGLIAVCAFCIAEAERRESKKQQKELNTIYEKMEQSAEITAEANKTKADARTGDHSADIKYMADKLHDYAKK